jgi:ribosomal protein S18 acetylase RimI-like enzyme
MERPIRVGDLVTVTLDGVDLQYVIKSIDANGIKIADNEFPNVITLLIPRGEDDWSVYGLSRSHIVAFTAADAHIHEDIPEIEIDEAPKFLLRELRTTDDLKLIKAIWKESLYEAQTNKESTDKYIKQVLREDFLDIFTAYSGKNGTFIVAYDGEYIAGFVGVLKKTEGKKDNYYLQRLTVRKEYRGKGLSTNLIDLAIMYARHMGLPELLSTVDKNNTESVNALTRAGFKLKSVIHKNIVLMSLPLLSSPKSQGSQGPKR